MALRKRDKKTNKYGRASAGRTSSGRDRDPGFYDLREQDPASAGISAGEPAPDERPYRERHRVEVRPAEAGPAARERLEDLYADRGFAGPDADLFPPVRSRRQSDRRDDQTRAQVPDFRPAGRDPVEPRRRVVRGNSPGERRGSAAVPASAESERRRDLSADLFAPQRSGQDSGRFSGAAAPASWKQRAAENRRSYAGSDGLPARGTEPRRSYTGSDRLPVRGAVADRAYRGGGSYREQEVRPAPSSAAGRTGSPRREKGSIPRQFPSAPRLSPRAAAPESGISEGEGFSETRQNGSGTSQREVRRRQLRRQREKQLRRTYMKIGTGIFAAILILVLVIHAVSGLLRRDQKAEEQTENPTAQEQTETSAQDQAGSGADSGEERELSAAEAEQTAPEKNEEQSPGPAQENTPEQDAAQSEGTETNGNGEAEAGTPAETSPDGGQTLPAEQEETGTASAASGDSGAEHTYVDRDDWRLILVNPWHTLPEGYSIETTALANGESVDSRCYQALSDMLEDCRAAGGTPIVCSSYRPHEKQVKLFEEQVASLTAGGMSREQAEKEAGTVVAVPGTSEHELGLAVDICDTYNQLLDASQEETQTQQWLMNHCWEYGFILRYPENKSEITGIIYEPWHYRYVGTEAAAQIHDRGICLEEYLAQN